MKKASNLSTRWFAFLAFMVCAAMALTLALPGNVATANAANTFSVKLGTPSAADANGYVTFQNPTVTTEEGASSVILSFAVEGGDTDCVKFTDGLKSSIEGSNNLQAFTPADGKSATIIASNIGSGRLNELITTIIQKMQFKQKAGTTVSVKIDGNETSANFSSLPKDAKMAYYPTNDHYYLYVPYVGDTQSWSSAYDAAGTYKLGGRKGYLLNVDDNAEQAYLRGMLTDANAWFGATTLCLSEWSAAADAKKISSTDLIKNNTKLYDANTKLYYPISQTDYAGISDLAEKQTYFYWASGPLGEKSENVNFDEVQCRKDEPNFGRADSVNIQDKTKADVQVRESCAMMRTKPGENFLLNDIPEGNYKASNSYAATGYLVEFGGWDSQDDKDLDKKIASDAYSFETPTLSYTGVGDPEGTGINQKLTATVGIENYDATCVYKYRITDETNDSTDKESTLWTVWTTLGASDIKTDEAGKTTASIPGLKYGDHVQVAVYTSSDEKAEAVNTLSFKVLASELLNGSFETVTRTSDSLKSGQNIYAWRTTASDKKIEVYRHATYGLSQKDGNFCAELNAYQESSLYQEIATTDGEVLKWGVSHGGRLESKYGKGADVMAVVIGPAVVSGSDTYKKTNASTNDMFQKIVANMKEKTPGKSYEEKYTYNGKEYTYTVKILSDASGVWGDYEGIYEVPEGQDETILAFTSISNHSKTQGWGNIVDAVKFAAITPVDLEISADNLTKVYDGEAAAEADIVANAAAKDKAGKEVTGLTYKVYQWLDEDGNVLTEAPKAAGKYKVVIVGESADGVTPHYYGVKTCDYTITKQPVEAPSVASKEYNGTTQTADVAEDARYTVTNEGGKDANKYDVVYTLNDADNYEWKQADGVTISGDKGENATVKFEITKKKVTAVLTVEPKEYNGNAEATVTAKVADKDVAAGDKVEIAGVTGTFADANAGEKKTVTVDSSKKEITGTGIDNYEVTIPTSATGTITKKPVNADVTVEEKTYDGKKDATVKVTVPADSTLAGDDVKVTGVTGTFEDANAGENKQVTIDSSKKNVTGTGSDNYDVTVPAEGKGTIKKAPTTATGEAKQNDLTYTGEAQKLVTPDVSDPTAQLEYWDEKINDWSPNIPTATTAGPHTVKYRVKGDINHEAGETKEVTVTIKKAKVPAPSVPASKVYNGETQTADVDVKDTDVYTVTENKGGVKAGSYDVVYTLKDADNYEWETTKDATVSEDGKSVTVPFAITKKAAAKVTAPTANNRTADGSTKPLLATPATTTEGEIEYSIDGGKTWTKGIPTASKAGTYTVCYRVAGDENHEAGPVQSVTVKIAEPDYSYLLNKNVSVTEKNGKLKVTWHKVPGAQGYKVYVQYCGKDFSKKSINQVKKGTATKITVTKVNGKKRDLKKNIKLYVVAYKTVNGKEKTIAKSITMHFVGSKNTKYTNPKKITLAKSAFTLKVGKTATIKGKVTLANPKKKGLGNDHARVLRFRSGNKKVATVSKSGKITAKGKGSCVIYVYARNGLTKEVKVTVK